MAPSSYKTLHRPVPNGSLAEPPPLRAPSPLAPSPLAPEWNRPPGADALGADIVGTVYFGGGTPTLMRPADFRALLEAVREGFDLAPDVEITTEANPESVTRALLEELRAAGINRLSLGMQSAVPSVLARLDRVHTPGQVGRAVGWARAAGFDNVSLDLIYGTPGESMADWESTVDAALSLAPDHISAYSLIVEEGTPLGRAMARGEVPYPDDDDLADKYIYADERFGTAGLGWYEVSSWARPGCECRHNLAYWRSDNWLGIGAGAHSHVNGVRWWNHRNPATYVAHVMTGSPVDGSERLTAAQIRTERIMLGLRLSEGVSRSLLTPGELERAEAYVRSGYLEGAGNKLVCTLSGRLVADGIVREILD